ncbi:MAG: transglutaminase domain-containing protein [Planctomycetaceae bacterium]|nr:transglutaminase domain-containing protein [Planctomycetaceae bacterium]
MLTGSRIRLSDLWLAILCSWSLFSAAVCDAQTPKPAAASDEQPTESWQVIYIGNQRVGYQYGRERVEVRDKRKVIVSDSESHFAIKRFGQELKISTSMRTEETESGDLLRFSFEMKNPPIQNTTTVGVVTGAELELTSTLAGRTDKRRVAWEADAKSPAYPERRLREKPLKEGESQSFKVYLPEFGKFSQVKFAAEGQRPVKLLDGKEESLRRVQVSFSSIPENKSRQFVDAGWRTKVTETDMLGLVARAYDVPSDVALQAIAGAELDLGVNTLVRINPPILDAHRKKRIVYRISMKEESPERFFVIGGTQQLKRLTEKDKTDHAIELTVTTKPIPPVNSRPVRTDDKYLAPTRFLQTRDPAVVEHAERAASGETDPSRIATRLEKYVHDKVTKKNFSTAMASAAEVAQRLEGDCTEHAVLLAALLRARKVPSRVAAGLVYVESLNSFGGHMWTEAFLAGEWIPLDATLGKGGIGPAHLKMADSALDEDAPLPVSTFLPAYQALGKLKIDVLKAE